jgi:GNAT superfamily N-acetyltransferase
VGGLGGPRGDARRVCGRRRSGSGYAELDPAQLPASIEISNFGLLPGFAGLGLGGHLLSFAVSRALTLAPRVWVHTCSLDGPHALANYEARGLTLFSTETAPG